MRRNSSDTASSEFPIYRPNYLRRLVDQNTSRTTHLTPIGASSKTQRGQGVTELCDGAPWTRQPAAPADALLGASPASMQFAQQTGTQGLTPPGGWVGSLELGHE
jgi:hypothetical protein